MPNPFSRPAKRNPGQPAWFDDHKPEPKKVEGGWRFTLKGSPRHYDDVVRIIEADPGAKVYFGEALTYERGAGVALWRVEAASFDWLPRLYAWWAEQERTEPIRFTFNLYFPSDLKYAALDLRTATPDEVVSLIKQRGARSEEESRAVNRRI
jgi:hypothetical protein